MRAVGAANGANPVVIAIPCHRVVGSDGSLTGYGGGLERKRFLLAHEGGAAARYAGSSVGTAGRRDAAGSAAAEGRFSRVASNARISP